ncbi:MAG TPA: phosphoglycerate kinase, partial [Candidatus Nitrosotenuis sp.]|nr:phosphoglycerate kinase [Candidatus Nitrosotenuis sp.]
MIIYIDKAHIRHKKVLLRVDFNVSMKGNKITDDERIRQTLPTIRKLLRDNNKPIIISHLGRPKGWDEKYMLRPIARRLSEYLKNVKLTVVDDFTTEGALKLFDEQKEGEILFLENIRFFKEEEEADHKFAKKLADLADVYVNDAFGVSHRKCASITEVPKLLPHYGGLLLEREVETIGHALKHPSHPFSAIIGGAKVSTKLKLLFRLTEIADYLILGGGLANTLLFALGYNVGRSLCEREMVDDVKKIVRHAKEKDTKILIPHDVLVGSREGDNSVVKKISEIEVNDEILDIGPETQALYAKAILASKTLIWNGPVGYIENPEYARGTDFLYYTISQN